jgi:hypothetical protein
LFDRRHRWKGPFAFNMQGMDVNSKAVPEPSKRGQGT